ncbi:MAG: hypothetical protein DHS20C21_00680 [Gemmatimonadota bacterium]|nr:MAG: hypothetical protein DHS20C21_00680 [Gemmatimonadota bacterium]
MNESKSPRNQSLAPPGISGTLVLLDSLDSDERTDEDRLHDSRARDFEVRLVLDRSLDFGAGIDARTDPALGRSLFAIPEPVRSVRVDSPDGAYVVHKNEDGHASCLSCSLRTTDPKDATRQAVASITRFLDHLCYTANAPVMVKKVIAIDTTNMLTHVSYTTPYAPVLVRPGEETVHREMFPIYALYREAKCSSSAFYRFMCLYKILEGVFRHLRPSLMRKARERGLTIETVSDTVPDHDEIRRFHPGYVGRPIKKLMDDELTPGFRNAVAHFRLESGSVLNPSDFEQDSKFTNMILISELSVRTVIDNQNSYYDQLADSRQL